jgi:hypothetical protein
MILNCLAKPMMPLPPLLASLFLRASASCSGLVPAVVAVDGLEACPSLEKRAAENSL